MLLFFSTIVNILHLIKKPLCCVRSDLRYRTMCSVHGADENLTLAMFLLQFLRLQNITVGNHAYEKNGHLYTPLHVCQQFYHNGSISPGNETFEIDAKVEEGTDNAAGLLSA